jgi:hypothetical protein
VTELIAAIAPDMRKVLIGSQRAAMVQESSPLPKA